MSLYIPISAVFTPHQGNFFLPQTDTITESHNQSTCRLAGPCPNTYIFKATPAPKAQASLWKEWKKPARSRRPGNLLLDFFLLEMSEMLHP